ncbi:MAG TPA: CvpA family protein [Candidatus Sulfotelmatobacter sp.]
MSPADWIIVVLVLLNVVAAAMQGFFAEALSMAGLVVGYIVAAWQYGRLADWFASFLKNQWLAEILGFLAIFFAVLLLFGIAGRVARWVMKEAGLSGFDRFLGGVLGLLKGALMVAVILMGMTAFTPTSKLLENSQLAPYFLVVGRAAIWLAPSALRARFYQGLDLLHRAPSQLRP